jgi:hypothetical protein
VGLGLPHERENTDTLGILENKTLRKPFGTKNRESKKRLKELTQCVSL